MKEARSTLQLNDHSALDMYTIVVISMYYLFYEYLKGTIVCGYLI